MTAVEYEPLIVVYRNGAPVRLQDIATVTDSVEDVRNFGMFIERPDDRPDDPVAKPTIMLIVFRQPGANIIATADRILALLPQLEAQIPADMNLAVAMDRTGTIRASLHDVQFTLLISIALVILVVFLFLRDLRATLIPTVAVPVSLIGTFGVMYLCGYSLDNLSLMALTIATGFVVDDAIVVIENISRHLEDGMSPMAASLLGAKEIGFTVLSISVSLVAVFIPILLMNGIVGRLFREFAVTLSVAIAVSLVVSLTTTPMMCAILLKSKHEQKHGRLFQFSERIFDGILWIYERTLMIVLRHQRITMVVTLSTIVIHGLSVYGRPERIFSAAGYRPLDGKSSGRSRCFVSVDVSSDQTVRDGGGRRPRSLGSSCIRWRSEQRGVQFRANVRHAEAVERAENEGRRRGRADSQKGGANPGCDAHSSSGSGSAHRWTIKQCAVPVHA